MRLVFASNNAHKLEEVRQIMPAGVEVLSLRDIGFTAEIEETGATLEENSRIKAEAIGKDGVFADDTGLEIDALDGKPGVYTARWSGASGPEQKIFVSNRAKALHELAGVENRGAQFRTVITLILNGKTIQVEGVVRGTIATEDALNYLRKNGLRLQGVGFVLTSIELIANTATGINNVAAEKASNDVIFNVAGQRVNNNYKGVVVKNGKKFIQK